MLQIYIYISHTQTCQKITKAKTIEEQLHTMLLTCPYIHVCGYVLRTYLCMYTNIASESSAQQNSLLSVGRSFALSFRDSTVLRTHIHIYTQHAFFTYTIAYIFTRATSSHSLILPKTNLYSLGLYMYVSVCVH